MPTLQLSVEPEQVQSLLTNEGAMASLLQSLLNQVLQAQATEQIGAEPYERTETRTARRNGTRSRTLTTRVGRLELAVPQLRDGVFTTDLLQRYQRTEQALIATLMEVVVNGVSTRKVARITEVLCGQTFIDTPPLRKRRILGSPSLVPQGLPAGPARPV